MPERDRKRKIAIGNAMAGNKRGEIIVLSCGMVGTVDMLFRSARGHGFNGCQGTFANRIMTGCRDFSELCRPVDQAASGKSKAAFKKKRQDPEFLAALAAVNARRGSR